MESAYHRAIMVDKKRRDCGKSPLVVNQKIVARMFNEHSVDPLVKFRAHRGMESVFIVQ